MTYTVVVLVWLTVVVMFCSTGSPVPSGIAKPVDPGTVRVVFGQKPADGAGHAEMTDPERTVFEANIPDADTDTAVVKNPFVVRFCSTGSPVPREIARPVRVVLGQKPADGAGQAEMTEPERTRFEATVPGADTDTAVGNETSVVVLNVNPRSGLGIG